MYEHLMHDTELRFSVSYCK